MMSGFCMAVYTRSQDVNPDEMDPRVPLLLHQVNDCLYCYQYYHYYYYHH